MAGHLTGAQKARAGARVGVAVFALGISLAGPQALTPATADSGDDPDTGQVLSGSQRPEQSRAAQRHSATRTARAGIPAAPQPVATTGQQGHDEGAARPRPRAAALTAGVKAGQRHAPVPVGPAVASGAVAQDAVGVLSRVSAEDRVAGAPAAADAVPAAAAVQCRRCSVGVSTPATVAPAPMVSAAAVGIAGVVDRIGKWLTGLPATPVTDFLSGALLMLRRTLLPEVPVMHDQQNGQDVDVEPPGHPPRQDSYRRPSPPGVDGPVLIGITSTPGQNSIVLTFDAPLRTDPATDLTNYSITAPHCGSPEVVTSSGPALRILAAQYSDVSPTTSQVTLTLAHPLLQGIFYRISINGNVPIITGNPASNPLTDRDGTPFDGDNDNTPGGDFYGLFALGRSLNFTDSDGDRVVLSAMGGSGINVWRELNGDIDQITVLPGASSLSGSVFAGCGGTGEVYIGSVTIPVPVPLELNGAVDNLPSSFRRVPREGLPPPPPVPTAASPHPVMATSENLPYTLNIAPVSALGITNLPGLQGSVYAQTAPTSDYPSGLWLVFGGRTNGLHNFVPSGEQSFPPSFQNNVVYVINPVDWQVWSLPWSQTDVPASVYSPLSSADQQYFQKEDTLYISGGYSVPGTANFTGDVSTASTTITVTSGLENLAVGQRVSGVLPFPSGQEIFPAGTTITGINGNTVTTSRDAEAEGAGVTFAAFTKEFTTYDTLTALSVAGLAQAVINGGEVAQLARIRQMSDPRLAVTGGEMANLNGRTYLVFGHNFQGGYNGATSNIAQVYTDEVRSFRIIDTGRGLAITDYRAQRDPVDFRRRDGNLVSFIGSAGQAELAYLGGVFTVGQTETGYQAPILIGPDGVARIDAGYQQYFNQYTTASIPLYDRRSGSMYTVLIGGISLYYYADGVLTADTGLPWVDNVTSLVRSRDGSFQEYSMSPIPAVTAGGTGYYGAAANFFINQALSTRRNGVIPLNDLRGPTVLGYMYGGLYSTVPNTGNNTFSQTGASNQVFQITLTPT